MKFIVLISLIQVTLASVVIDCTFPCKITTEACVVSSTFVKCAPVSNNQWILRSRNSIPVFQGTLSSISQTCQSVPFPTLPHASTSSIAAESSSVDGSTVIANSTETIIEWPPVNIRNPYDKYLGNCESNAFCSDQLVCTQRYNQGHYCESTHQCVQGSLCTEYTCQATTSFTESSGGLNTIHIIAAIVGVVLAIVVLLAIYLFRRRRNRRNAAGKSTDHERHEEIGGGGHNSKPEGMNAMSSATSSSSTSASTTQSATISNSQVVTTILPYEAHFENNNNNNNNTLSSPSQQQQELQYQLQRQAYHDHKDMTVPPPPPYTP